jgi:hypothetical protein
MRLIYEALITRWYIHVNTTRISIFFDASPICVSPLMDDRRSVNRAKTSKAAWISFGRRTPDHSCDVEVTDLGNGGAGIYKPGKAILPLTFELSFDKVRQACRIVWRRGDFFGVIFEDPDVRIEGEPEFSETDIVLDGSPCAVLDDPLQWMHSDSEQTLADRTIGEVAPKIVERKDDRWSDARFTVGVAVVLSLPVLFSFGAYFVIIIGVGSR